AVVDVYLGGARRAADCADYTAQSSRGCAKYPRAFYQPRSASSCLGKRAPCGFELSSSACSCVAYGYLDGRLRERQRRFHTSLDSQQLYPDCDARSIDHVMVWNR